MKANKAVLAAVAVVLLVGWLAGAARADIIFDDGAVHDITWTINGLVEVRDDSNGNATTVNILPGARLMRGVLAYDNSHVNFAGGWSTGGLMCFDSSRAEISAGTIQNSSVNSYGNSHVTISGGDFGMNVKASGSSQMVISGGTGMYGLTIQQSSSITLVGDEFSLNGIGVPYGEYTQTGFWSAGQGPETLLTGTLANGDAFGHYASHFSPLYISQNARLVLVPEPATLGLLALGGLALLRRRRRMA